MSGGGARQWAAAEARAPGWGGISLVSRATGLSRPTLTAGMRELDQPIEQLAARVRRAGGGRLAVFRVRCHVVK